MEQCWAGEPSKRPLLGAILPVLESVLEKTEIGKSVDDLDEIKEAGNNETIRNPALALAEPNNQRGTTASLHPRRRPLRTLKHPVLHMTNLFNTSLCSNLYIQMREF